MKKQSKQTTKYLFQKELARMYDRGKGRKKHDDKKETNRLRNEAKNMGIPYKDRLYINKSKDYIYSQSTFDSYKKFSLLYCEYLAEKQGIKKVHSLEETKPYIQSFVNYLEMEKHYSAYSINLALAAVCKATGGYMCEYTHPRRRLSDIKRSSNEHVAVHDGYNAGKYAKSLEANRLLGLRRSQLGRLLAKDITVIGSENSSYLQVAVKGKGGRINKQLFYDKDEIAAVLELKNGKKPDEHIFTKDELSNDCDYHACRAARAREVYYRAVEECNANPERRQWYVEEVKRIFKRDGKELLEDINHPIFLRGEHRKYAVEREMDVTFDRALVLFVSVTCLSHNRSDVSVVHYICKPA